MTSERNQVANTPGSLARQLWIKNKTHAESRLPYLPPRGSIPRASIDRRRTPLWQDNILAQNARAIHSIVR